MKLIINIPKEFEEHFNKDKFSDSLARVASDIENFGVPLSGRYEQKTITMLRKAFEDATPLETQPTDEIKEAYLKGYDYGVKDWFKSKTQPCEDAVSREAVLSLQTEYAEKMGATTFWKLRDDIRGLPSVTPQRTKGKWIDVNGDKSLFECSKCGDKVCCANNNYCPNCGSYNGGNDNGDE